MKISPQELIEQYGPLVRSIAEKISKRRHREDFEDLISIGTIALLEAVDGYDEERGAKFSTYVYYRIWGDMMTARLTRTTSMYAQSPEQSAVLELELSDVDVFED